MPRDVPFPSPTTTRPARHRLRAFAAALALVWVGGFVTFLSIIPTRGADPGLHTDAIVVLTGPERARVTHGLDLLADHAAPRLLVSGMAPWVGEDDLLRWARRPDLALPGAVTLGRSASDTVGNALETAAWMRAHRLHSLRLVTADYHMPRALWLMRLAMPHVEIVPDATIHPFGRPRAAPWYLGRGVPQRLAEYQKDMAQHVLYWLGLLRDVRLHEGPDEARRDGQPSRQVHLDQLRQRLEAFAHRLARRVQHEFGAPV